MDSKTGLPTSYDEEVAPPSYTESNPTYPATSSTSRYYSLQIQDQLHSLTSQITSLQTQQSLLSHAKDEKILSLLTTQIQTYLSDFANSGLQKGTLILVPASGLTNENAIPVEYDFKNPSEYDRVVRVRDKEADEYGETWFWRDADMAERLAEYLRPVEDPRTKELPPRKEEVKLAEQSPTSSRGFWGRKKSTAERPPLIEESRDSKGESISKTPVIETKDRVAMDVKAEEVVFRFENDFGIYESERGYGIVLKLRIALARK